MRVLRCPQHACNIMFSHELVLVLEGRPRQALLLRTAALAWLCVKWLGPGCQGAACSQWWGAELHDYCGLIFLLGVRDTRTKQEANENASCCRGGGWCRYKGPAMAGL